MIIRSKFIIYVDSIVNTQAKIRQHFEKKRQKLMHINTLIDREFKDYYGVTK